MRSEVAVLAVVALLAPTSRTASSRKWVLKGDVDRDLEADCAWDSRLHSCQADMLPLLPGQAYVVDGFVNDKEQEFLQQVRRGLQLSDSSRREVLGASAIELTALPGMLEEHMLQLLRRVHGHARAHLSLKTGITEEGWRFDDSLFLDHWAFRRYDGQQVSAHADTGHFGRCLSATLHIGQPGGDCCEGGDLQTFRCRQGNCTAYGWDYDAERLRGLPDDLLHESNLAPLAKVRYRAGRLVFFLAETLHAVSEVSKGAREVLFMWFSCAPTLINGAVANGHAQLVRHLLRQRADVHAVLPSTGDPLVHFASVLGVESVLSALLEHRADPDMPHPFEGPNHGDRPLHYAAATGHLQILQLLLGARASPDSTDLHDGRSPLHTAAAHGHLEAAKILLAHSGAAGARAKDFSRRCPLDLAVEQGHAALAAHLAEEGNKSPGQEL